MLLQDSAVVVTGGAGGIGAALARAAARHGARAVLVVDRDGDGAAKVAGDLGTVGAAFAADLADPAAIEALIAYAEAEFGGIDVYFSNAGIAIHGGLEVPDADWDLMWSVNVMAHVRAARALLPGMRERGGGHIVITASAAALLADLNTAPYTATKHAAHGLAQWLAITHYDEGIRFHSVCPLAVDTEMIYGAFGYRRDLVDAGHAPAKLQTVDEVAEFVVAGVEEDRFLLLPDPDVLTYAQRKAADPERWMAGMRRFRSRTLELSQKLGQ